MIRVVRRRAIALMGALALSSGVALTTAGSAAAVAGPVTATVSPVNDAKTVAVGVNIFATFNVNVTGVSGASFTLVDVATGTAVPAVVSYSSTTRVATLDPVGNLPADKKFRATLTDAIRNGSDLLPLTTWTFTTGPGPAALYRWPSVEARGVEPWTIAQVSFNEAVTGVNATTFTITNNSTGAVVPGRVVGSSYDKVWRIYPTANLPEDTWFTVKAVGGVSAIRDLAGNPFSTIQWRFLTGLRPLLTTWNIVPDAVGVSTATALEMGFSETITGINTTTFTLTALSSGAVVPASVSWSSVTGKWVLSPAGALSPGTQYRLALTGGTTAIRDLAGNPLASMGWNFTTA
jgi:hypothetical protein